MKISVIAPVKDEVQFIGYSIMSVLPYVHEILYACAVSSDGTDELLSHMKDKYAKDKLKLFYSMEPGEIGERAGHFNFDPHDMQAYNASFNYLIEKSEGDAVWFLHPDMIVTKWSELKEGSLAWWTNVTSYAGDLNTVITKGRCDKWKNIHAKKFGLHYYGAYGSINEDFYHRDITGKSYKHFGTEFSKYPFKVLDSGIQISHYCELKSYKRRLEKMKLCLKTQNPEASDEWIEERAVSHPRVTLEDSCTRFGKFEFAESDQEIPEVITQYKEEFDAFTKSLVCHSRL